jgi:hypothetical protein
MTKMNVTEQEQVQMLKLAKDAEDFNLDAEAFRHGLEKIFGASTFKFMAIFREIEMVVHKVPGIPYVSNGKVIRRWQLLPEPIKVKSM